jgi:HD-GYP domain-containing protein (c-di-GMP phosphodiesterase class II)/DNA-binding CsgD family transcriptional regulator
MSTRLRLADLLASLSVVADLGFGLPPEQAMRSSLISTALARRLGLDEGETRAAFYVPLLMHIGCISMSHETAAIFGNEIAITRAVAMTNLGDPHDIVGTLIPEATRGLSTSAKEKTTELILTQTETFGKQYDTASSEVARQTARRIGLPEAVQRGLFEVAESWQGGGAPQGLQGEEIALSARITRLASDAAFFNHIGDANLAVEAIRARAGTIHDPDLAREFISNPTELLADANTDEPAQLLQRVEPGPVIEIDRDRLVEVGAAFGNAADLKSPYTHGHSGATAQIAVEAGKRARLTSEELDALQLASLLHDIGRVAISDVVWEKPGPLNSVEWEQVRTHAYHAERILARSPHLELLSRIVGMHHERLDGSGYHRGSRANEIPLSARLVAVSDAWVSMQQPRSHRPALDPDEAATELQREVQDGKLDREAVNAVLQSAGHATKTMKGTPAGLSRREIEVLRLVAAGHSNPEIAARLHISRRTAEHHVQHIYTKIGVASRPGAALFAVENDLLEPVGV